MTKEYKSLSHFLEKEWKAVNYVVLGAAMLIFLLNITAMLSYLPTEYSFLAFDISVFGAIIIILYAVYNLTVKKH